MRLPLLLVEPHRQESRSLLSHVTDVSLGSVHHFPVSTTGASHHPQDETLY
jgi:hypothetical protein